MSQRSHSVSQSGGPQGHGGPSGTAHGQLTSAFVRLQSLLTSVPDVEEFLAQVAELAAAVLGAEGTSCGITMGYDGKPVTVASSDHRASALDESQYQDAAGPCLHTLATGIVVDIPDTGQESQWPAYLAQARTQGLRCSLSLPLAWDTQVMGALNMYGFSATGMFSGPQRTTFEIFAAQAAGSLWLAQRHGSDALAMAQLEEALASRTVIDQAMGVLMGQQRCTADVAFTLLRMASQRDNRKLRDVAVDLVTRVTGQAPVPGRAFK